MSNSAQRQSYREFLKEAASRYKNAGEVIKQAADEEALNGIKDPDSKGTTSIPGFGDGSNRSALSLPENKSNMEEPNKDRNIINVTNPDGTGQGEYIKPRDGDALDAAATSPTTPLEKMSGLAAQLKASAEAIQSAFSKGASAVEGPKDGEVTKTKEEQQTGDTAQDNGGAGQADQAKEAAAGQEQDASDTAPQEKQASPGLSNEDLDGLLKDPDIMSKLAKTTLVALGTEDGARALQEALEKQAGAAEARAIIQQVTEDLAKEAAAASAYSEAHANVANQPMHNQAIADVMNKQASDNGAIAPSEAGKGTPYALFRKVASDNMAHGEWLKYFNDSPLQKRAYAQGAADGEAAADAMAAGGAPDIPGAGDVTEDDVIAYLQQLVESGQIQEDEAEAVLQALGNAASDGVDPQEFADAIRQAVESGELSPEEAEVVAQQYLAQFGGGAEEGAVPEGGEEMVPPGAEEDAAAAAAQDPVAAEAAAGGVQKAASVVKRLWSEK